MCSYVYKVGACDSRIQLTSVAEGAYAYCMTQRVMRSTTVVWNVIDGEAVLLNTETGLYFGMNKTATALWSILDTPKTVEEVIQAMARLFPVDKATIATDVAEVMTTLESKRLIERTQA